MRDRICLLDYPPGTALSETELARQYGVSRTPIRRVLQMLEADGLVETKPNVGSIVTTVDLKALRDAFALRIRLSELLGDMNPVSDFAPVLATLDALLQQCQALACEPDNAALCAASHRLQEALLSLSGNSEYRLVTDSLYFKTVRSYYMILPDLDWSMEARAQLEEVQDIIVSLRANDIRAVGLIRRNHIARTLSRIMSFMMGGALTIAEATA
ncbi:GntR family transcriptional regulator [Rhizobium rhizosphaerae]|uniref:GntR family transcriptional regulator n=1 Tax=Xaviernesmea rhizosphaerae TaxID=1672749 RepID=A0A1Q9AKN7_9HYPH|nr:GntR family transcriptional regulator [Xaviernesmea rhizosphaerae]